MEDSRDRKQVIERGMHLAANLPDIMPEQADDKIKPVYEDIQRTLRVPIVNLIFRTLANYPDFLISLWKHHSPSLRTFAFEQAADNLRRNALLEPVPDAEEGKREWEKGDDLDKIRAFNNTIHYVLPKLLLATTAFEESTFGLDGQPDHKNRDQNNSSEIPMGAAAGTTKVKMLKPEEASDRVRNIFNAIKERHGHPLVSSYFRGLGNWPDFLEHTWHRLSPLVGSPDYEDCKNRLIQQTETIVQGMFIQKVKDLKLNPEQSFEIKCILAAFRLKFIPEMLLDATLIKAMLDGTEEASSSPFSVQEKSGPGG